MNKHTNRYTFLMGILLFINTINLLAANLETNAWSAVSTESAMQYLFGTSKATEDKQRVVLTAPDVAANGGAVPVRVSTTISAKRIALFQDANPTALVTVWSVHENSVPEYDIKIRLISNGGPITLTAVVEGQDGKLYSAQRRVQVALGGCDDGGEGYSSYSTPPVRSQAYGARPIVVLAKRSLHNTEEYKYIDENGFKEVSTSPLSTFSVDVDTASYAMLRSYLMLGNRFPPKDAVRIEEMINYFNYDYKEPKDDKPFYVNTRSGDALWDKNSKIIQIGLQTKKVDISELPASNLVFLLDVSGSMSDKNKLPLLIKSLKLLVQQLREKDRVSIVVYAGNSGLVLDRARGDERERINRALESLSAGGSTAGGAGINLAYAVAEKAYIQNGNNRVILATDGDFNVGASSESALIELIEQKKKGGVFLSVLGFGNGNYKDNKMEALADKGNGNYSYIDTLLEAKKVLVTQMGGTLYTVAKDVKIQVEFNPAKVQAYRLIGYENRLMANEDFNDDKKDAGEIGKGHRVTALYEYILNNQETGSKVDRLKYQTSKYESYDELATVKIRYKDPKENSSKLMSKVITSKNNEITKDDFYFTQCIAGFGMLLRGSEYAKDLTYPQLIELSKDSKGSDRDGHRAELVNLIVKAQILSDLERNK